MTIIITNEVDCMVFPGSAGFGSGRCFGTAYGHKRVGQVLQLRLQFAERFTAHGPGVAWTASGCQLHVVAARKQSQQHRDPLLGERWRLHDCPGEPSFASFSLTLLCIRSWLRRFLPSRTAATLRFIQTITLPSRILRFSTFRRSATCPLRAPLLRRMLTC